MLSGSTGLRKLMVLERHFSAPLQRSLRVRYGSTNAAKESLSGTKEGGPSKADAAPIAGASKSEARKSQAEKDEELRHKLESISGGGGEAGLELENGQPVAMKRGVKQNMFRLI